jgi:hypothetical protein
MINPAKIIGIITIGENQGRIPYFENINRMSEESGGS